MLATQDLLRNYNKLLEQQKQDYWLKTNIFNFSVKKTKETLDIPSTFHNSGM
jgi:hypothetical protein